MSITFTTPAPTISDTVALPTMISLFGDISPAGAIPDSPLGPGWTTLVVQGPSQSDPVTLNLKSLLLALLPMDIPSHIPSDKATAWNDYLTALENSAMTYDSAGGIWRYTLTLDGLLGNLGSFIGSDSALNLALENLRLGVKTVPVSATNPKGSASSSIGLTVVDAQIPLRRGWNAISAPFRLSGLGYTASHIDVMLVWNFATQSWQPLTFLETFPEVIRRSPLEAFFIHATAETQVGAVLSRSFTAPPTRTLSAGWNLVGSAPDFIKNFTAYYPKTGTGSKMQGLMRADDSFISALKTSAGLTGYTMVLSLGQEVSYTDSYKYGTYSLGTSYPWLWGQPAWSYTTLDSASIPSDPVTSNNYFGWVVPFGAYWVYMENPDTLAGFTSTPVSREWLAFARQQVLGP